MQKFEIGQLIQGRVTGLQPYGAFVALDEDTQGLIHISEITNGYVKDIRDFVSLNEVVTVKVLAIDEQAGKISLSLRQAKQEQQANGHEKLGFHTLRIRLQDWIDEAQ